MVVIGLNGSKMIAYTQFGRSPENFLEKNGILCRYMELNS